MTFEPGSSCEVFDQFSKLLSLVEQLPNQNTGGRIQGPLWEGLRAVMAGISST